jgi:hypothetical protein
MRQEKNEVFSLHHVAPAVWWGILWGMKSKESKKPTRHGLRAPGKTQTSLTMSEDILSKAKTAAAQDGRSLSNYIEQLLKRSLLDDGGGKSGK